MSIKPIKEEPSFEARQMDYELADKNKKIGNAGEEYIFHEEERRVDSFNLGEEKKVRWMAKEEGDGLGYDILSYDSEGNELYIEVKTTQGDVNEIFYITSTELEKSKAVSKQYVLYRVHNFDMETKRGEIAEYKGNLIKFCKNPILYKVVSKKG